LKICKKYKKYQEKNNNDYNAEVVEEKVSKKLKKNPKKFNIDVDNCVKLISI
jgi:hypothetical protein